MLQDFARGVPTVAKSWTRNDTDFSDVDLYFKEFALIAYSRRQPAPLFLDTGPPGARTFAELILQRSLLVTLRRIAPNQRNPSSGLAVVLFVVSRIHRGARIPFSTSANFKMRNKILILSIVATICAARAVFAQTINRRAFRCRRLGPGRKNTPARCIRSCNGLSRQMPEVWDDACTLKPKATFNFQ